MSIAESIRLPYPTNRTGKGPILFFETSSLVVEYDYERDEGGFEWTQLKFYEVLAYEYRQNVCCQAEQILESQTIQSYSATDWLSEIQGLWKEAVGWQEWQNKQGGEKRFKQYRIFFDNAGCLDVIASSFDAESCGSSASLQ